MKEMPNTEQSKAIRKLLGLRISKYPEHLKSFRFQPVIEGV